MSPKTVAALSLLSTLLLLSGCGGGGGGGGATTALVTLFGSNQLAEVELSTGAYTLVAPPVGAPHALVGKAGYDKAVLLDADTGRLSQVRIADPGVAYGDTISLLVPDQVRPYQGAIANGKLAFIDTDNVFGLWSLSDYSYTYTMVRNGSCFWDVCTDGTSFFVPDYGVDAIFVFDNSGAVISSLHYTSAGSGVPSTSKCATTVGLSPDGKTLYVGDYFTNGLSGVPHAYAQTADDLLVFAVKAGSALSLLRAVPLKDSASGECADLWDSHEIQVTADGSEVWVACDGSGSLAVYDTVDHTVKVISLQAGGAARCTEFAMDEKGGRVVAPGSEFNNPGTDLLYVVDMATKAVADTIALPPGSRPTSVLLH